MQLQAMTRQHDGDTETKIQYLGAHEVLQTPPSRAPVLDMRGRHSVIMPTATSHKLKRDGME
jgi:hypothetical protein